MRCDSSGEVRAFFGNTGLEVAAHNLLRRGLAAGVVVGDRVPGHVHAHVGRRSVRALPEDAFEEDPEQGERFDIAVVVDGLFTVRFEMERVDEVDVVEIRRCRLVGEVHGVFKRKVPDRERLKFRVARGDSTLVVVINLRQARRELARPRPRRRHDNEVALGFRPLILAEALLGHDEGRVRVAFDRAVAHDRQTEPLHASFKLRRRLVTIVHLREHDRVDEEAALAEHVHEAQNVLLIRDAKVGADLVVLDVVRVDRDEDFELILQLIQHRDLVIGREPGKDT